MYGCLYSVQCTGVCTMYGCLYSVKCAGVCALYNLRVSVQSDVCPRPELTDPNAWRAGSTDLRTNQTPLPLQTRHELLCCPWHVSPTSEDIKPHMIRVLCSALEEYNNNPDTTFNYALFWRNVAPNPTQQFMMFWRNIAPNPTKRVMLCSGGI